MPRRSSRGRAASRRRSPMRNPPQTARPASSAPVQRGDSVRSGTDRSASPAPVQRRDSARRGTGSTTLQGIAFGIGNAIAHRAVDALLRPSVIQQETVVSSAPAATESAGSSGSTNSDACNIQSKAFQDCINSNGSDIS